MSGILIQNGYMVNPAENKEGYADIRIRDGSIERIEFFSCVFVLSTANSAIFSPSKKKKLESALGRMFSTNIGQLLVKNSLYSPSLQTVIFSVGRTPYPSQLRSTE